MGQGGVAPNHTQDSVSSGFHCKLESIFLVASLIRVRHEVERVVECARVLAKLDIELDVDSGLRDCDAFDGDERGLRATDDKPPALLLLLRVIGCKHRAERLIVFHGVAAEAYDDASATAGIEGVGVLHLVLQGYAWEAIARPRAVHELRLRQAVEKLVACVVLNVHHVENVFDFHALRALAERGCEMWKLHQRACVRSCRLHDHLREFHSEQCGRQPSAG
mmetsp:Transcript_12801/g.34388  ORF Transcript_12801/g.34388 Transcript_12801/m.34388 type:complete len:221 (+) Transcript_12801:189-851(+)